MCVSNYQLYKNDKQTAAEQLHDRVNRWFQRDYTPEQLQLRVKLEQLSRDFINQPETKAEVALSEEAGEKSLERLTKDMTIPEIATVEVVRREIKSLISGNEILKVLVSAACDTPVAASKILAIAVRSLAAEAAVAWEKTYPRLAQQGEAIINPPAPEPEPTAVENAPPVEPQPEVVDKNVESTADASPVN